MEKLRSSGKRLYFKLSLSIKQGLMEQLLERSLIFKTKFLTHPQMLLERESNLIEHRGERGEVTALNEFILQKLFQQQIHQD